MLALLSTRFLILSKTLGQNFSTEEQKKLLRWNKKHFLLFLKDFHLPEINSDLGMAL